MSVPAVRVRALNAAPVRADGEFVLYWMTAQRRLGWNFALERALERCAELRRPLVIFEPLRAGYRWASARLHRFVLDGMVDHRRALARRSGVVYFPYVEPRPGAGRGLLEALAARACLVVGDDYPCFFLPRMLAAAAERVPVLLEAVDSNGLLPLRAAPRVFERAFDLRRFLQRALPPHLAEVPRADPLRGVRLPPAPTLPEVLARWAPAGDDLLSGDGLRALPIDATVAPTIPGGPVAGAERLAAFLARDLAGYGDGRNHPDADASSGLSPYLHFGHVSAHQVLEGVAAAEEWSPASLEAGGKGQKEGWWRLSAGAESFLDELVTWRELGFNLCSRRADYADYGSLPAWAQATLAEHAHDPRAHVYRLASFEAAATHDALWNAAQRQLVREGRLHNYLRMLWGKKILEWSPSPEAALEVMLELNNKYALDGRDPNSYSGIFWVLGRYDRAWGPERPIYGKIRYMSSEATRKKLRVKEYLARYGAKAPVAETQDLFAGT